MLITGLVAQISANSGLSEEGSKWAVEAWIYALDIPAPKLENPPPKELTVPDTVSGWSTPMPRTTRRRTAPKKQGWLVEPKLTALILLIALVGWATAIALLITRPSEDRIVISDDFSDAAAGLLPKTSNSPDKYIVGYSGGEYFIRTIDSSSTDVPSVYIPKGPYRNAVLSIDARILNDPGGVIELACRSTGGNSQYRLTVTPKDRTFSISRWEPSATNGKFTTLVPISVSDAVKPDQYNQLKLSCLDSDISAEINGATVASIKDPTLTSGDLWFAAYENAATIETKFDNLRVSEQ